MFSTDAPQRRLILFAAPVAALTLALAACSSSSTPSGDGPASTKYAAVIKGLDNPFFQSM